MIRKASLEEAKLIYTKNMEKDFPEDEIPDYNKFVKLTEKNIHDVYLYNNNNYYGSIIKTLKYQAFYSLVLTIC